MAVTGPYVDDGTLPLDARGWIWVFLLLDGLLALIVLRRTSRNDPYHRLFQVMGFVSGLGRGPRRRRLDRLPGRLRARHPAGGGDRHRSVAARDLRYPAGHPSPDRRIRRSIASSLDADLRLLFAALVPLGALILMLATGLESTASFVVVAAATVSVIVLALARMWRLVDQVRLTEQRGHDRLAAMVEHLERRGDARRPDWPCQLRQPRSAGDARLQPESWVGAPARRRQRGGARRAIRQSNGSSSSATAARSSSRRR